MAAEEEDGAIYGAFAERLKAAYPGSAAIFEGMAAEEDGHRRRLLDLYVQKFGRAAGADPARACARLPRAQAGLADATT